ncbi:hypothetical protein GKE82_04330 [Conexibacter sp. W3-3-2]|uniref:type II secretion system F family protein n=1 Tax=Conexibacter sp. W3-3-2 TaxID=2675227 RepID=UPI0012B88338|nr:type II secretion system F family protein [Conexibacter sp. W3-3-2]MTD43548.1 hypothetical protein [Conexibacter sp. W3-3-2]
MSVAALTAGLAAASAVAALGAAAQAHAARPPRAEPAADRGAPAPGPALAALLRLGRRTGAPRPSRGLAGRLAAAGLDARLTPADLMAIKGATVLLVAAVGLTLLPALGGTAALPLLLAVAGGGFLVPDRWLVLRARRRAAVMAVEVADVLDLLRVGVAAGRGPVRALAEVGRRHPGLLAAELRRTAREIGAGTRREEALEALRARCPLPAVAALVAALRRAERHGVPLAPALAAIAADARADRVRLLADHAARAAPKIQLVIALLLVPGVLLLVAAAMVSTL